MTAFRGPPVAVHRTTPRYAPFGHLRFSFTG